MPVPMEPDTPAERPTTATASPVARVLESSRFLVAVGAVASVLLAGASFVWAVVKGEGFVEALVRHQADEVALVKLFESVDMLLIGTVLLTVGLGLWELFIGDLRLPPALTVGTFDQLKAKVASTLLLVLVVRFLERLVSEPADVGLLYVGISVTLVGGLLLAYSRWRH